MDYYWRWNDWYSMHGNRLMRHTHTHIHIVKWRGSREEEKHGKCESMSSSKGQTKYAADIVCGPIKWENDNKWMNTKTFLFSSELLGVFCVVWLSWLAYIFLNIICPVSTKMSDAIFFHCSITAKLMTIPICSIHFVHFIDSSGWVFSSAFIFLIVSRLLYRCHKIWQKCKKKIDNNMSVLCVRLSNTSITQIDIPRFMCIKCCPNTEWTNGKSNANIK